MRENGLALLPYFPLASGMLTGKYQRDAAARRAPAFRPELCDPNPHRPQLGGRRSLTDYAETRPHDPRPGDQLARLQAVRGDVIAGATKPDQVRANAAAVNRLRIVTHLPEVDRVTR